MNIKIVTFKDKTQQWFEEAGYESIGKESYDHRFGVIKEYARSFGNKGEYNEALVTFSTTRAGNPPEEAWLITIIIIPHLVWTAGVTAQHQEIQTFSNPIAVATNALEITGSEYDFLDDMGKRYKALEEYMRKAHSESPQIRKYRNSEGNMTVKYVFAKTQSYPPYTFIFLEEAEESSSPDNQAFVTFELNDIEKLNVYCAQAGYKGGLITITQEYLDTPRYVFNYEKLGTKIFKFEKEADFGPPYELNVTFTSTVRGNQPYYFLKAHIYR